MLCECILDCCSMVCFGLLIYTIHQILTLHFTILDYSEAIFDG
jgi:hypothetical protein